MSLPTPYLLPSPSKVLRISSFLIYSWSSSLCFTCFVLYLTFLSSLLNLFLIFHFSLFCFQCSCSSSFYLFTFCCDFNPVFFFFTLPYIGIKFLLFLVSFSFLNLFLIHFSLHLLFLFFSCLIFPCFVLNQCFCSPSSYLFTFLVSPFLILFLSSWTVGSSNCNVTKTRSGVHLVPVRYEGCRNKLSGLAYYGCTWPSRPHVTWPHPVSGGPPGYLYTSP